MLLKLFISIAVIASGFCDAVFAFSRKANPEKNWVQNQPESARKNNLMIIPVSAPVEFRFNDSFKLQEHMPRSSKAQIDILNWLAERYKFTYAVLSTNETTVETPLSKENKGSLSYLLDETCDLLLGDMLMTSGRYQVIDMPFPWLQRPLEILMPVSDARANFNAIFKPFQYPVWILFVVSLAAVITTLESCLLFDHSFNTHAKREHQKKGAFTSPVCMYIFGVIVSQGGSCITERRTVRLVAGAWCLTCFVLVQAYTCTLIPYVIAPNSQPLIESIFDIEKNPHINLLVEKNLGLDIFFSGITDRNGIFHVIRERINAYPESRCNRGIECIDKVGSGGPFIFVKAKDFLLDLMLTDFEKTGSCRLQIAKEGFLNMFASFGLPKHSPYTIPISKGLIELNAFGLIEYWMKFHAASPRKCLDISTQHNKQSANPRLSLKNLTGAFVILVFGYMISILVFVIERLKFTYQRYRNKSVVHQQQE